MNSVSKFLAMSAAFAASVVFHTGAAASDADGRLFAPAAGGAFQAHVMVEEVRDHIVCFDAVG